MYFVLGFALWRVTGRMRLTLIPILIAAAAEATIGWMISAKILSHRLPTDDVTAFLFTIAVVILLNSTIGIAGMWIARASRS